MPTFSLQAIMGISIPLLIVTMAGQNGPGLVMLRTSGYTPNDRLLLSGSSRAPIKMNPESHGRFWDVMRMIIAEQHAQIEKAVALPLITEFNGTG